MRLVDKLRRKKPAITDERIREIRDRVRSMREQVGKRDLELADLFSLVKEDERLVHREIKEVKRPEGIRVWPNQGPSETKPAFESAQSVRTPQVSQTMLGHSSYGAVTLP